METSRSQILGMALDWFDRNRETVDFVPGESIIPVSGKVIDGSDIASVIDAALDGWLTSGRFTEQFQRALAKFVGVRSSILVNSGSSANLLALSSLTSPHFGERRLLPGDEVITVAMGFPTTVNPIIQNRLVPVLVDIEMQTYNALESRVVEALSPKTRAIMMAHTLGNPFNLDFITKFCKEHNLWLIEDSCDALGSTYSGKRVGGFGDLATLSFYPAHHITTGEGGAILVNSPFIKKTVESFRDWGRDCYCETGCDNTCKKRFGWTLGDLPPGYDHKYIYSHIGYNLKATDLQAALGLSQLSKLDLFVKRRRENFAYLSEGLKDVEGLILPRATEKSEPSWFGFPITLSPEFGIERRELLNFLEEKKIGTRLMFAGNITKQPAYRNTPFRVVGDLNNSDLVMNNSFWVGVYPGLNDRMLDFVIETISEFMKKAR